VATSTSPGEWWNADDETLATVLDIFEQQAREAKRKR
jgi:hypothetical protein